MFDIENVGLKIGGRVIQGSGVRAYDCGEAIGRSSRESAYVFEQSPVKKS